MIGKINRRICILTLLVVIWTLSSTVILYAKEPAVTLAVEDASIEMGRSTTVTITLQDMDMSKISDLELYGISDFKRTQTQQGSNVSIINGVTTKQYTYRLTILPQKVGEFNLQAVIFYNKKQYKSQEIKVTVKERNESRTASSRGNVFVESNIDKKEYYFGEKILLSYDLYSRYNIYEAGFSGDVTFDGFIAKDLLNGELPQSMTTIDGQRYLKVQLKKAMLTPVSVGEKTIPAKTVQALLQVSSGFFDQGRQTQVETDPITLNIKPLPEAGKPNNFTGLVGNINIEDATYNRHSELPYGESMTLSLRLAGNANLELLTELFPKDLGEFKVYETDKGFKEQLSGDSYRASREFEVIFVPNNTGNLEIKPMSIPFFNVETGAYDSIEIPGKVINVTGEKQQNTARVPGTNEETSSGQKQQVVISQINGGANNNDYFLVKRKYVYVILVVLILMVCIGIAIYFLKKMAGKEDQNLKGLYDHLLKANSGVELYDGVHHMIKYQYNVSLKASTYEQVIAAIPDENVVKTLTKILNYIENYPNEINNKDIKKLVKILYGEMK